MQSVAHQEALSVGQILRSGIVGSSDMKTFKTLETCDAHVF